MNNPESKHSDFNYFDKIFCLIKPGDLFFYCFTILWPAVLLTLIPFSILESPIGNFSFFLWITDHEPQILYLFLLLLLVECPIFILYFIACITSYYLEKLSALCTYLINATSYAILLLQLFRNIGILNYGVLDYFDYIEQQQNILVRSLCIAQYSINLLFILLMVAGYFFRSTPTASKERKKEKEYIIHVDAQFHVCCDSKETSINPKETSTDSKTE